MTKVYFSLFFFLLSITMVGQSTNKFEYPGGEKALKELVNEHIEVSDDLDFKNHKIYHFMITLDHEGYAESYSVRESGDPVDVYLAEQIDILHSEMEEWIPQKEIGGNRVKTDYRITLDFTGEEIGVTYKEQDPQSILKALGLDGKNMDDVEIGEIIELK